jgi:hypothetical protein
MNKYILKILIVISLSFTNLIQSQTTTIDYTTFSSSNCNIFGVAQTFNGILHQTTFGQPTFNNGNKSVQLSYYGSLNKGSEYKMAYNFKQNYTYKITLFVRNATGGPVPAGLKVCIGDNGSSNACDGTQIITNVYGISKLSSDISQTTFIENIYNFNNPLAAASNFFRISSYKEGESGANPAFQTMEIKKIIIEEFPPVAVFNISPSTVSINCGSTSPVSFSVSNVYNSPGTLTYNWNVGSGWSGTYNATMSTISLTPTAYPPGNISVTPIYNGVPQITKTCTVSLAAFNPTYSITGSDQGCPNTSSNYSISAGTNTVTWSLSNASLASLNTTTGSNVILTGIANGSVTLNATVTNSCGQSKVFPKTILIGKPVVTNTTITGGSTTAPINTTTQLTVAYVTGATGYQWTVASLSNSCVDVNGNPVNGAILPKFSNNSNTITTVSPIAFVNWGDCPSDVVVNCSATNACGLTGIGYKVVSVYGSGGGGNPCPGRMVISPNPVKEDVILINIADPIDPCGPTFTSKTENNIKIYDLEGNLLYSNIFTTDDFSISGLKLIKGNYIINAFSAKGYLSREIIIVE